MRLTSSRKATDSKATVRSRKRGFSSHKVVASDGKTIPIRHDLVLLRCSRSLAEMYLDRKCCSYWFGIRCAGLRARPQPAGGPILKSANIPASLSPTSSARISVQQFALLWRAVSSAIEDEAFDVGARAMRPGTSTCFALASFTADHRAGRYAELAVSEISFWMTPRHVSLLKDVLRSILLEDAASPRSAFAYRAYWVMLRGVICWLVGRLHSSAPS